jgi:hypothetical protein
MSYSISIKPDIRSITVDSDEVQTVEFDGIAASVQINVLDGGPVSVFLNDCPTPFTMGDGDVQSFVRGDIHITSIGFALTTSGGEDTPIEIIAGVEVGNG